MITSRPFGGEPSGLCEAFADYFDCIMQDEELGNRFVDAFVEAKESLETLPERGTRRLRFLPAIYRLIPFWPHLWLIYRVGKKEKVVYIDLMVDDRSDYGSLFNL